jgi:peroxiredoxin Q/BCP
MPVPAIGTPAPDFELRTDSTDNFRLSRYRGRPVVLYFYPQDDTEGCTLENIEFTELMPEFERLGAKVVGISPDSVEKHCSFRDKYNLGIPLASDPDHKVIDTYGLWQLKKMFAAQFMGVKRATVVVDAEGNVAAVVHATRIKGHAAKVLEVVRALQSRSGK